MAIWEISGKNCRTKGSGDISTLCSRTPPAIGEKAGYIGARITIVLFLALSPSGEGRENTEGREPVYLTPISLTPATQTHTS